MATTESSQLSVARREPSGSRSARRLRRTGQVPGVIYGGGEDPIAIEVDARILRNTLNHAGAVLNLSIDGEGDSPVVVKELVRHPVNGAMIHIDLLRVRMDTSIESTVIVDLLGVEEAPGVKSGGVLEQVTREVTIAALPGDIPDTIQYDASGLEAGATLTVADLNPPKGVTIVDDPETVIASITAPRLAVESDTEIETETERVGETAGAEAAGAGAEADAESGSGDAASADGTE